MPNLSQVFKSIKNGPCFLLQVLNKRLTSGLEGREPIVVILDDSSAVWPHDRCVFAYKITF